MQSKIGHIFALVAATLGLAACNAGPLLKTGSLSTTKAVAAQPPGPVDRALHVAATSARAQKCGFFFDPAALRGKFLEAEAARGTTPELLAKTGQSYDFTANSVSAKITEPDKYCDSNRTATVKASLQNVLAGNFEPPAQTATPGSGGLADFLEGDEATKTTFNTDHIYDPLLNEKAEKKVEE